MQHGWREKCKENFDGETSGKAGRLRRYNIKMDIVEIGCEDGR
jgi:hypothetical protein